MSNFLAVRVLVGSLVMVVAGCAPEEPGDVGGPLVGDVDGGTTVEPDAGGGATCSPAATSLPNGNHNAGMACLGCHTGSGAPRWRLAGTLYATSGGGAAIAGATITVTDAAGVVTRLVTAANGNFYTGTNLTFPVRVSASKCPDTKTMSGGAPNGDCNSCHQAATVGRIHLP